MAHVVPGLEALAWEELAERAESVQQVATWSGIDRRAGALLFRSDEPVRSLLDLRLTEDLFAVAAFTWRLAPGRRALRGVSELIRAAESMEEALRLHREAIAAPRRARPTYRVVVRKAGRHAYRRVDAQRACEAGLARRFRRWRLVEDGAGLEFWLQIVGEAALLGLRLSSAAMRQRTYRETSLPASLKPAVAHALVRLARPSGGGLLLDPACGSATVLAEAAGVGLAALGGDIEPNAVRAARRNLRAAGASASVACWDATRLPLANDAVAGLACNLPWGRQQVVGDLVALYRGLLAEALRVVRSGGRIALLTSEGRLLEHLVRRRRGSVMERRLRVTVRGTDAWLFVLQNEVAEGTT
jgi:23S rRNA G2445 N2-methylase RlmL